jgi:hypothetical protein
MRASRVPDAPGCAGYGHPGVIGTFLLQRLIPFVPARLHVEATELMIVA